MALSLQVINDPVWKAENLAAAALGHLEGDRAGLAAELLQRAITQHAGCIRAGCAL